MNRQTDRRKIFENIFVRILDSKRDFNGFLDPAIYCSRLQIHLLFGPGFWTSCVIKIFLPGLWIRSENGRADLVNKIIIMDWQICITLFTPLV